MSPKTSNSWLTTSQRLHHLVLQNVLTGLPVRACQVGFALGLCENNVIHAVTNSSNVGVQNHSPTWSIVWEKHPTSKTSGYNTFTVDMATLFTEALSRIKPTSALNQIWYST